MESWPCLSGSSSPSSSRRSSGSSGGGALGHKGGSWTHSPRCYGGGPTAGGMVRPVPALMMSHAHPAGPAQDLVCWTGRVGHTYTVDTPDPPHVCPLRQPGPQHLLMDLGQPPDWIPRLAPCAAQLPSVPHGAHAAPEERQSHPPTVHWARLTPGAGSSGTSAGLSSPSIHDPIAPDTRGPIHDQR